MSSVERSFQVSDYWSGAVSTPNPKGCSAQPLEVEHPAQVKSQVLDFGVRP